jgi:nicotinamide mononucleotide transporter
MIIINWFSDNYIEVFGAITGIIYVFLEIRQNLWLWPVGIATSAVYIWIFLTGKLYADMSLQGYYLIISVLGWYWWIRGSGQRPESSEQLQLDSPFEELVLNEANGGQVNAVTDSPFEGGQGDVSSNKNNILSVSHLKIKTGLILLMTFIILYTLMWIVLDHLTDSPVPGWDSFITSLSIIATWMLARKILEHWYLWIVVNGVAVGLFLSRGLYPTVFLYAVYCSMSFIGLKEWKKTI